MWRTFPFTAPAIAQIRLRATLRNMLRSRVMVWFRPFKMDTNRPGPALHALQ